MKKPWLAWTMEVICDPKADPGSQKYTEPLNRGGMSKNGKSSTNGNQKIDISLRDKRLNGLYMYIYKLGSFLQFFCLIKNSEIIFIPI